MNSSKIASFETRSRQQTVGRASPRAESARQRTEAQDRGSAGGRKGRKRQRTAALQDAVAMDCTPLLPRGLGVRLSSAALASRCSIVELPHSSRQQLHSNSILQTAFSLLGVLLFTCASCFGSEKSDPKDKDKKPPEHQRGWIGGEYKLVRRHGNWFMTEESVVAFPKSLTTNEKKGLLITALSTNTPAYIAGLREGDLILELDHSAITGVGDFRQKIDRMKPGSPLEIRAFRNQAAEDYDLTVGRETYNHLGMFAVSLLPILRQPNLKFNPGFSLIALGLSWNTDKRAELGSPEQVFRRNCSPKGVDVSNSHWRVWLAMIFIEHAHQIRSQEIVAR